MINRVILVGFVGREPEVRSLETGVKIARISLATTERYTDSHGERQENTQWHSLVCWRAQADFVERWVHTGAQVYIEGKLRYREITDAAGRHYQAAEVHCDLVRQIVRATSEAKEPLTAVADLTIGNDNLPF
ncbi:MAG: single-stranded DNA-binding protein [Mucinivorans sp.]